MGLRLSEGLNLTMHDIDKSTMLVHVLDDKGGKDLMVPVPELTLLALRRYWKTHRHARLIFSDTHTTTASSMDKGSVQKALKRMLEDCRIKKSSAHIRFAIIMQPTYLNKGLICALCSNYLNTPVSTPLHTTRSSLK